MRFFTLCCVLLLTLTACGGGDEDAGSDTTAPITTTTAGVPTTAAPTTMPDDSGGGDVSPANCPELVQWAMDSATATQAAFTGGGLDYTAEYFQEFADRAPAEISDDMRIFADAFQAFFEELEELGIDFTDPQAFTALGEDDIAKLEAAITGIESEPVEQALDRIQAFFERECS